MDSIHTLHLSQAWPVLVDDCSRFLTELEKSSGFCSVLTTFPGVLDGEPEEVRLGGILLHCPDFAVRELEEAE